MRLWTARSRSAKLNSRLRPVSADPAACDVGRDAPRFVFRQYFRLHGFGFVRSAVDVDERLVIGIAHDVAAGHLLGAPRCREAAGCGQPCEASPPAHARGMIPPWNHPS